MAALHREKLRTFLTKPEIPTSQKSAENVTKKLDLDYDTMEYKSILPPVKAVVIGKFTFLRNSQYFTKITIFAKFSIFKSNLQHSRNS